MCVLTPCNACFLAILGPFSASAGSSDRSCLGLNVYTDPLQCLFLTSISPFAACARAVTQGDGEHASFSHVQNVGNFNRDGERIVTRLS